MTLLGIFPHGFSDCANFLLPRQLTLSLPIVFVIVVPNVTAKTSRSCAHLKPVTRAETISGLGILQVHNLGFMLYQNSVRIL